jgi:hypothetical protein
MKVPVLVEFEKEVEVNISAEDIGNCLATSPRDEGLNAALSLINDVAKVFNGLPDSIIAEMSPKHHEVIRGFLNKAASRFAKCAAENSEELQASAQQAAGTQSVSSK